MTTPTEGRRIRWLWVCGCAFVGIGFMVAAFVVDAKTPSSPPGLFGAVPAHWHWQGTASSLLVNLGTAAFAAAVLFLVEPRFTESVARRNADVIRREVNADIDERIAERTAGLQTRLDELTEATREVTARRTRALDDAIDSIDVPTRSAIARAMALSHATGGLAGGGPTVGASPAPGRALATFAWGHMFDGDDELTIHVSALASGDKADMKYTQPVTWEPDETAEAVGDRIRESMEQAHLWSGDDTFDWALTLRNLQQTLRAATRSRRADPEWPLKGALYELVGRFALTTVGVEDPATATVVVREGQFPSKAALPASMKKQQGAWRPQPPNGTTAEEWTAVLDRGLVHFPIRRDAYQPLSSWTASTNPPDP